jgi:hypothetical protein
MLCPPHKSHILSMDSLSFTADCPPSTIPSMVGCRVGVSFQWMPIYNYSLNYRSSKLICRCLCFRDDLNSMLKDSMRRLFDKREAIIKSYVYRQWSNGIDTTPTWIIWWQQKFKQNKLIEHNHICRCFVHVVPHALIFHLNRSLLFLFQFSYVVWKKSYKWNEK